ncbi:MAG: metallophosphoesterase [Halieaceae bacterium]|nr:metallophosphoesterase [Halieaceae bacterium]
MFRLGIIGDLHTHWDDVDIHQIGKQDYDLLFFTGDLGGGTPDSSLRMARSIARLRHRTLVMPGNNDTVDIDQLAAELNHQQGVNRILAITRSNTESGSISLCGYSHHRISVADRQLSLIAARPHSMGGPELTFPDYMAGTYGINSLDESTQRLRELVDDASGDIIFLAHNGPAGLGDQPGDIWGCDFRPGGGDWGDTDLAAAIDYARTQNKQVLAVIAGHMHLSTRQGAQRPWQLLVDDTCYINAARVPRIFSGGDDVYRHHVRLCISKNSIEFSEILLPQSG